MTPVRIRHCQSDHVRLTESICTRLLRLSMSLISCCRRAHMDLEEYPMVVFVAPVLAQSST